MPEIAQKRLPRDTFLVTFKMRQIRFQPELRTPVVELHQDAPQKLINWNARLDRRTRGLDRL